MTTAPNADLGAVHLKAMPVILTTADEIERWNALKLQRPLPDGALRIVARSRKRDGENALAQNRDALS